MGQTDLFEGPARWRRSSTGETARDAALTQDAKAPKMREEVLSIITEHGPSTPEEVFAVMLSRGRKTVLQSVRARCSDLAAAGVLKDSGSRRTAQGGCKAIVWMIGDARS